MNKHADKTVNVETDDLAAHYDFDYGKAKPNRFSAQLSQESIMVVLYPDVAAIFPTPEAVNSTLRAMAAALAHLPKAKTASRQRKARATPAQPTQA
jgi:hypothetical protein